MECIICGKWFSSTDKTEKVCMTCGRVLQHPNIGIASERLLELSQAEKDGRLVVLPCKVGDTLYSTTYGEIKPFVVASFEMYGKDLIAVEQVKLEWEIRIVGKTAFLTREEAEAEMKKREADDETD